jgi:hypothetical protein
MTRSLRRALAAAVVAAAAACGGDKTVGPVAGTLKVVLTRPGGAGPEGAILFSLSGPAAPASPAAGSGLAFWGQAFSGAVPVKVMLTGPLANGQTLLTFSVNDVSKAAQYTATIVQVAADTAPYPLVSTAAGYSLSVTK